MELNINVNIEVGKNTFEKFQQLLTAMVAIGTGCKAGVGHEASETAPQNGTTTADSGEAEAGVGNSEGKAKTKTKTKTKAESKVEGKGKAEGKAEPETETKPEEVPDGKAENVANELPMDDGSRRTDVGNSENKATAETKGKVDPTVSPDAPYGTSIQGIPCKRDVSGGHDQLVEQIRQSMNDCMTRFIGDDYKNRSGSKEHKRYYMPLKSMFLRIANELGQCKPSQLDDDKLRTFILEVDLLQPNPETGEIEKSNLF